MEDIENEKLGEEGTDTAPDYLKVIEDLKSSTVSKEDYRKLREENKRLLQSLANGEKPEKIYEKPKIEDLRKDLFGKDLTNLEFAEKALELREALMEDGQNDPFLPYGKKTLPTDQDIEGANRVAEVLKDCIEYADGDPSVFTAELQRRTIDTSPSVRKNRR